MYGDGQFDKGDMTHILGREHKQKEGFPDNDGG